MLFYGVLATMFVAWVLAAGPVDRVLAVLSIVLLSAALSLAGFGLFELARHGSL